MSLEEIKRKHNKFVKTLNKNQRKLLFVLEFFLLLNVLLSPLYLMWYFDYSPAGFNLVTAAISNKVLNIAGLDSYLNLKQGISISAAGAPEMFISNSCSGIIPMFFIFALILATPGTKLKPKFKHILADLCTIYIVNIFRIVSAVYVGTKFSLEFFDIFHMIAWRYLLLGIVLILWLQYIRIEKVKLTY